MRLGRWIAALCVLVAACGGSAATTTTDSSLRSAALDYAATADRALEGTRFEAVGTGAIADAVVAVCGAEEPLDAAVASSMAALDAPAGPADDDEILTEVLQEGAREVCPDRAGADEVIQSYLDAVHTAVSAADPTARVDDAAVLAAGPVACDLLDRDQGPEAALLGVVAELFGVEAASVDDLEAAMTPAEGVVAGATLASATGYLCSSHTAEVAAFLDSLGSP